ncbi:NAD(P)/FAD-dependent oxidoreductase [Glycomyces harbinensis]|uniref:NADH dehydrogenase, FAD-containing subunit n=1 Tax=Glycomyces harbinensis TaxID=58114 RepID=A0A1G7B8Y3_9ACTN|nr:FAD-dependent oxidoreductase [Glycomyces harbinensis]SDE23473.1 NADH dehydrogenase, FAD-containing subunit [Glycomyces harbinensis]
MKHRIVVLGSGYAGATTAGILAHRLHPDDFEITVVNAAPVFVQRMRLHQLAVGREVKAPELADVYAGTGVRLRLARVTAVHPGRNAVTVTDENGDDELAYDTLVYALGSTVADQGVPGVAEHAFHVTSRPAALRLKERLDGLSEGAEVVVVGEGLTGIETVTEFAEARPDLSLSLVAHREPGAWLSPGARRHLKGAFDRLGVTVHEHTDIERVEANRVIAADGTVFESDATVWTAGFTAHPIAAAAGLEVTESGRIAVDRQMRSLSHPNVYAVGDSVFVIGDNGRPMPMSCGSAGYTSMQAVSSIVGLLTGRKAETTKLSYIGNHISLGRKDAIFQLVDGDAQAKPRSLKGRTAARVKADILSMSLWAVHHPTFGIPKRRHRLATAAERAGEAIAA